MTEYNVTDKKPQLNFCRSSEIRELCEQSSVYSQNTEYETWESTMVAAPSFWTESQLQSTTVLCGVWTLVDVWCGEKLISASVPRVRVV